MAELIAAGLLDQRLIELLESRKEAFNRRFVEVRQHYRQLSPGAFSQVLRERVLPVADTVLQVAPEHLAAVFDTLYDTALRLTALELIGPGSRQPLLDRAFVELLPSAAHLIAPAASERIPALLNALYNLGMEPAADAERWLRIMVELAQRERRGGVYLDCGKVAAWICGMAHYRDAALSIAPNLPREHLASMLDVADAQSDLPQRLADPWLRFDGGARKLRLVARSGGFIGFDGPFVEPPDVACFGDRLYAFDRQAAWRVFADRFGVLMRRYGTDLPDGDPQGNTNFRVNRKGEVRIGEHTEAFPQLADCSSQAATAHTLAVALPHSHHIFLVAVA